MEETKDLIVRLRISAKNLRSNTILHTMADLMDEAADMLEKQNTTLIANIECKVVPVDILDALADVSCEKCADRIRAIRDTH